MRNLATGLAAFAFALAATAWLQPVRAQAGNSPPLRIVVGFPPGGSVDLVARLLAEKLRVRLGRAVVVDNRPGAVSRLARAEVKRSPRDGNTVMFSAAGGTTVLPHLYSEKSLGYVPAEFAAVARVATVDYVLAASPKVQAKTLDELRAWLRVNQHATYGTPGTGTIPHLVGLELAATLNAPMVHVPYKGLAPAIQDLAGGHIAFTIASPVEVLDMHRNGKLRVIAAVSDHRAVLLPDVPTLREQGLNISADSFFGVWVAAGTGADVIARLSAAIVAVLKDPDTADRLAQLGLRAAPSSAAEMHAAEQAESARWQGFIRRANIVMPE